MTHLSFQSGYIAIGQAGSAGQLTIPSKAEFEKDPSTHLMVYMSGSVGGGRAMTSKPCGKHDKRFCKNGCGKLGFAGVLGCAGVSINHIHFVNLIPF